MDQRIRCPNPACPQPDDVQKVSAIVQSGTMQGFPTFTSGTYSVQTALSQALAAPMRPENKGRWGPGSVVSVLVFGWVFGSAFLGGLTVISSPASIDVGTARAPIWLGLLVFFGVAVAAVGIIAWMVLYKRAAAARFKREYPPWVRARARWELLYYSPRCDGVFIPGESRFVPPARMRDLLDS